MMIYLTVSASISRFFFNLRGNVCALDFVGLEENIAMSRRIVIVLPRTYLLIEVIQHNPINPGF